MRVVLGTAATIAVCIGMSGCIFGDMGPIDRYNEDFHYTYAVDPKARIDAESFNGPIEIEGWDHNEVEISGSKYASSEDARDAIRIDVHNTPDSVSIRAIRPSSHQGSMGAKFTLHVPRTAEVDRVTTSNGQIRVRDVSRAAHLKSSNGPVRVTGVHGDVDANTSNGPIDVEALDGAATLKTSNGHIHAEKITGSFEAETSNGGIVVRLDSSPSMPLKMTTSNGAIDLTMEQSPQSDIRAETKNSSITVHLPPNASAKLTADTSNSSVTCDFDVAGGENEKGHLKGNIGAGGHTIDLTDRNGHIRIAKGTAE